MNNSQSNLIYGIEDRPPFKDALFVALQHLLVIFVVVITPPLIISEALGVDLATLVIAVSVALGLGVELMPAILNHVPQAVKTIFSSGITTGGVTAILANIFIHIKEDKQS